MNYKIHNINARVIKLTVILRAMKTDNRPFFKGFLSFVAPDDEMEVSEARDSIYFWWWQFARLSPVLWYANTAGIKPIDPAIAKVSDAMGDVWSTGFAQWWKLRGRYVYAETRRPAKVRPLDLKGLHEHPFDDQKLYVEVPLNIRQQTIIKQFKEVLASAHEGRSLNLAASSTAQLALHTKRFRLPTIEREYWVMLYRLLYPTIEIWRIGDRLQVAPHLKVRDTSGLETLKRKHALNAVTGRYLYKARFTVLNLERDSFPNFSNIDVSSRKQPFGSEHQKDFRAATDGDNEASAWSMWLRRNYLDELHFQVKNRIPRLAYNMQRPESKARHKFAAFVAGTSDLLE
jgi:hypothetical protein